MNRRALTLVELLTVIILLSAVAAALLGIAGPMSAGARRAQAVAAVSDALERARLLAESAPDGLWDEPVATMRFGAALVASDARGSLPPQRTPLPRGWVAALATDNLTAAAPRENAVAFWRRSGGVQSDDAEIVLRGPREAHARVELLGISGQALILSEERGP